MKQIYLTLVALSLFLLASAPQSVRADENLAQLLVLVNESPCDAKDLATSVLQEVVQGGRVESVKRELIKLSAAAEAVVGALGAEDAGKAHELECGVEIRDGVEMVIGGVRIS